MSLPLLVASIPTLFAPQDQRLALTGVRRSAGVCPGDRFPKQIGEGVVDWEVRLPRGCAKASFRWRLEHRHRRHVSEAFRRRRVRSTRSRNEEGVTGGISGIDEGRILCEQFANPADISQAVKAFVGGVTAAGCVMDPEWESTSLDLVTYECQRDTGKDPNQGPTTAADHPAHGGSRKHEQPKAHSPVARPGRSGFPFLDAA